MTQALCASLESMPSADLQARLTDLVAQRRDDLHSAQLVLYAGGNVLTPDLRRTLEPALSTMPAMGRPFAKEQPGSDLVSALERLTSRLAMDVFGAGWADCRLPSCTIANLAVFRAFGSPGDGLLAPAAADGGHLSQRRGGTPSLFGLKVNDIPFDAARQMLDTGATAALIRSVRPAMIMLGRSVILKPDDLDEVVEAARGVGTLTVYDASHVAGLIAGGCFPNPLAAGVDLMTMSTYKTLAGPTGAVVAGRHKDQGERFAAFLDAMLLANQDASRLPPLTVVLAQLRDGSGYPARIVEAAVAFKQALKEAGRKVLLADEAAATHQIVMPVGDLDQAVALMQNLEQAGILVGRCVVPGSPGQHGLRFGTQFLARMSLGPEAMHPVANLVDGIIEASGAGSVRLAADHPAVAASRRQIPQILSATEFQIEGRQ